MSAKISINRQFEYFTTKESTFIYNDKSYYVPCGFYVWTKQNTGIDLREVKVESSNEEKKYHMN